MLYFTLTKSALSYKSPSVASLHRTYIASTLNFERYAQYIIAGTRMYCEYFIASVGPSIKELLVSKVEQHLSLSSFKINFAFSSSGLVPLYVVSSSIQPHMNIFDNQLTSFRSFKTFSLAKPFHQHRSCSSRPLLLSLS